MNKFFFADLLFPPKCMFCGDIIKRNQICEKCKSHIQYLKINPETFVPSRNFKNIDKCISFYYYDGIVRKAVIFAKFKSCRRMLNDFFKYTDFDFKQFFEQNNIDYLISMPYHKSKLTDHIYDLPQEIVKIIAKRYDIKSDKIIVKIRKTKNQHNLKREERKTNLKDAFKVTKDIKGKNIVIFDDVVSTGGSLEEAAKTLKKAGAAKVFAITFAYNK